MKKTGQVWRHQSFVKMERNILENEKNYYFASNVYLIFALVQQKVENKNRVAGTKQHLEIYSILHYNSTAV